MLIILLSFPLPSVAKGPAEVVIQLPEGYVACHSAEEFKKSVQYFKSEKLLLLNDAQIIKWALAISRGCEGAQERFKNTFDLLVKSGVDLKKSVEMAEVFSKRTKSQADAFAQIFKLLFLENKFDLDFLSAFHLSEKLSLDPTKADIAKSDIEKLLSFCTSSKELSLPIRNCAEYATQLFSFYGLYPAGLYPSFQTVYAFLSSTWKTTAVAEILEVTREILSYGPLAPNAFIQAYEYSITKAGLGASQKTSLTIALQIAKSSLKDARP